MRTTSLYTICASVLVLAVAACSSSGQTTEELNASLGGMNDATGATATDGTATGAGGGASSVAVTTATSTSSGGGSTATAISGAMPGTAGGAATTTTTTTTGAGGAVGTTVDTTATGGMPSVVANVPTGGATVGSGGATVGSGGATVGSGGATVGSGGATVGSGGASDVGSMGGMGGATVGTGGVANAGATGMGGMGPFSPRTGSFKMLAYSKTTGFRHDSINAGKQMLTAIANDYGFEVVFTESNEDITPEGLAQYEIFFSVNSTGDIFNNNEQQIFEDWMTTQDGAFGGVHSATDTENGWQFYSEVTGQYYNGHDSCCSEADVQWDSDALDFIAVQGLPNPWRRAEEWYYFDQSDSWATKAGFKILGRVTTNNKQRPVSYVREWSNFRSFYTSLGHQSAAFEDAQVRQHVARGIMWAVRREAMLDPL